MRLTPRLLVAVVATALTLAIVVPPEASAQTTTTATTLAPLPEGAGSIIGPKPGQGVAPDDAGDRGGAAQIALFFVIVVALGGGVLLVRRDMARSRSAHRP